MTAARFDMPAPRTASTPNVMVMASGGRSKSELTVSLAIVSSFCKNYLTLLHRRHEQAMRSTDMEIARRRVSGYGPWPEPTRVNPSALHSSLPTP